MSEFLHCDGPGCGEQTSKSSPSATWLTSRWTRTDEMLRRQPDEVESSTSDKRTWHYCSWGCQLRASAPGFEATLVVFKCERNHLTLVEARCAPPKSVGEVPLEAMQVPVVCSCSIGDKPSEKRCNAPMVPCSGVLVRAS